MSSSRAAIITAVSARYYVLSAIGALFRYIEAYEGRIFYAHSIRVRWQSLEGTLTIDYETACSLELVQNALNPKSKASLYGIFHEQKHSTPMSRRLLRMNLLAPITNVDILESRLDAVEECLQDETRRSALAKALAPLRSDEMDIDRIAHRLLSQKGTSNGQIEATPTTIETRIGLMLNVSTWLNALPSVQAALEGSHSALLCTIEEFLAKDELPALAQRIASVINPDLQLERGFLAKRNARLYAVQSEHNPLLDVARQTYKENLEDTLQLAQRYKEEHDHAFELKSVNGAFFLSVKSAEASPSDFLASVFLNLARAKNGKGYTMTTLELKKLNQRLHSSMQEVLLLSDAAVEQLRESITEDIACLYKVGLSFLVSSSAG